MQRNKMAEEEGKTGSGEAQPSVVEACIKWATESNIDAKFDEFARENAEIFAESAESKDDDPVHKLEYTQCHERFLEMFETQIEGFLEEQGISNETFFTECQQVMNDQFCALFEDHQHKWFVDMLLGMMEYNHFYGLMINEARRRAAK